jgi:hypothetical protein
MRDDRSQNPSPPRASATPWHVPVAVDDIAPTSQHFDLSADAGVRAAVAQFAGLRDLPRLEATFDVTRHGADGVHVAGLVSATVGQTCVVTLEPLINDIEEAVDLVFLPQAAAAPQLGDPAAEPQAEPHNVRLDDPEPLIGGAVDLGAIATEFLMLGIDPYPRKPGAVFEPPHEGTAEEGPFAVLAKLTKGEPG